MHDYIAVLLFFTCDAATCIVPIIVAILAFLTAVWNGISAIVIKRLEFEKKSTTGLDSNHAGHKEHKHQHTQANSKTRTHTAGKS